MDEPLSNLDAQVRVDMRAELRRLQIINRITTVYVTHDQVEAMAMADRIAIMDKGVLQQVGTPDEVYVSPANLFVANFIGSPSMNFIPCTFDAEAHGVNIQTHADSIFYRLPENIHQSVGRLKSGAELILGVRPEDVYIHTEPVEGGFESQLVMMEALGSENIHHLQHGDLLFVSRTSPADVYLEGLPVWVTFETEGIRLFDRKTEAAI
jgi:multiple sugar transport system ATP-binding protein